MPHIPSCSKENCSPSGLYVALDPYQVLKLNDHVVTTTDLKVKHTGSNSTDGILVACLNVGSLLKNLFFMHKQNLPQQQTSPRGPKT